MRKNTFRRIYWKMMDLKEQTAGRVREILCDTEGMGTVEVILIILVLIGLVIIFKSQLTSLVNSIFARITSQAGTI